MAPTPPYETSVFINCPFDAEYAPIFEAILFTLLYSGFTPRSAADEDKGSVRFAKIVKLIKECQLGIHDISRIELDAANHLPRFNMPFELGMDIGCKAICTDDSPHNEKEHLILCKTDHQFQKYLSDISGHDGVKAHNDNYTEVIEIVRDWLRQGRPHIPGTLIILKEYGVFKKRFPSICRDAGLNPKKIIIPDFTYMVEQWLTGRRASSF